MSYVSALGCPYVTFPVDDGTFINVSFSVLNISAREFFTLEDLWSILRSYPVTRMQVEKSNDVGEEVKELASRIQGMLSSLMANDFLQVSATFTLLNQNIRNIVDGGYIIRHDTVYNIEDRKDALNNKGLDRLLEAMGLTISDLEEVGHTLSCPNMCE